MVVGLRPGEELPCTSSNRGTPRPLYLPVHNWRTGGFSTARRIPARLLRGFPDSTAGGFSTHVHEMRILNFRDARIVVFGDDIPVAGGYPCVKGERRANYANLQPLRGIGLFMDSAQLYSELLECGDRLLTALANEREANVFNPESLSYPKWQIRLRVARRKVELAAEYYAIALRTYRVATLSEFVPSELIQPCRVAGSVKPRERARTFIAACRHGKVHSRVAKLY